MTSARIPPTNTAASPSTRHDTESGPKSPGSPAKSRVSASGMGPCEKRPVIADTTGSRRLRLNLLRFGTVVPHGRRALLGSSEWSRRFALSLDADESGACGGSLTEFAANPNAKATKISVGSDRTGAQPMKTIVYIGETRRLHEGVDRSRPVHRRRGELLWW